MSNMIHCDGCGFNVEHNEVVEYHDNLSTEESQISCIGCSNSVRP